MPAEKSWTLLYRDGNGNGYRFWTEENIVLFEYSPIKPKNSSSGIYSGGNPKKGVLSDELFEILAQWIERLEANTPLHSAKVVKGSGTFRLSNLASDHRFTIRNSPELGAFNNFLEVIVSQ